MKIPLNMNQENPNASKQEKARNLEKDILAAKSRDWNAKNRLAGTYMPLIKSLAEKRTADTAKLNNLIESGREGLFKAARKYKKSIGPAHFQVFALDFIETAMDKGKSKGFLASLFGG